MNKPATFSNIGGVTRVYLVYWNNKNIPMCEKLSNLFALKKLNV